MQNLKFFFKWNLILPAQKESYYLIFINLLLQSPMCVCFCVCLCVYACVPVCVYVLPPQGILLSRMMPKTCIRVQFNDVTLRISLWCLCLFTSFPFLDLSYFTSSFNSGTLNFGEKIINDEWRFIVMNETIYISYMI